MGGSVGVALFGALFNNMLTGRLGTAVTTGEGSGFRPDVIQALPEPQHTEVVTAFADALTAVFRYATALLALAFALTWFLREVPLRATRPAGEPEPAMPDVLR
jgi:hypothetical protein